MSLLLAQAVVSGNGKWEVLPNGEDRLRRDGATLGLDQRGSMFKPETTLRRRWRGQYRAGWLYAFSRELLLGLGCRDEPSHGLEGRK